MDSVHYGPPQLHIRTPQGVARVWLLRAADTFFVAATIPDSTWYWGDDFVVSLDTRGDGGDNPQHDDFQLGGWEVSAREGAKGWSLLLRLDPAWLEGAEGRLPRQGWFAWPLPPGTPQPSSVEQTPDLWVPIRR